MKFHELVQLSAIPVGATLVMMAGVYLAKTALGNIGLVSFLLLVILAVVIYATAIFLASRFRMEYNAIELIRNVIEGFK